MVMLQKLRVQGKSVEKLSDTDKFIQVPRQYNNVTETGNKFAVLEISITLQLKTAIGSHTCWPIMVPVENS